MPISARSKRSVLPVIAYRRKSLKAYGPVGIPMMGGPPVAGRNRFPPTGIPITGAPPVAGMTSCGDMFGPAALASPDMDDGKGEASLEARAAHADPLGCVQLLGIDAQPASMLDVVRTANRVFIEASRDKTELKSTGSRVGDPNLIKV